MTEQFQLRQIEPREKKPSISLVMRPQTAQEEFDYLWFLLGKMPWYREKRYSVSLPEHPEIQKFALVPEALQEKDKSRLLGIFLSKLYDVNFLKKGLARLEGVRSIIETTFSTLTNFSTNWGFTTFEEYQIHLTRYGPGGNYNPSTGVVRMMTRQDGSFKRPHPSHTSVHEIVHIGLEEPIVKRFGLTHSEKERLVDLICLRAFGHLLLGYTIQKRGNSKLDTFITDEALNNLPSAIRRYVSTYPRDKS